MKMVACDTQAWFVGETIGEKKSFMTFVPVVVVFIKHFTVVIYGSSNHSWFVCIRAWALLDLTIKKTHRQSLGDKIYLNYHILLSIMHIQVFNVKRCTYAKPGNP